MKQAQRLYDIVKVVKEQGYMTIEELTKRYEVTPQTLRRDLNTLADEGKIKRHHGGAASIESSIENTPYQQRKAENQNAKLAIAKRVAQLIPNNASLFINIGTTNEIVAEQLMQHQGLTVVTNNIYAASILSQKQDFSVIIAGGEVRFQDGGIIGEATRDFIQQFRMDFSILGISGIESNGALLDFDFREVKVSQAMLAHAQHNILVADGSKFHRQAMVEQAHMSQINTFVCDREAPSELMSVMKQNDVRFIKI